MSKGDNDAAFNQMRQPEQETANALPTDELGVGEIDGPVQEVEAGTRQVDRRQNRREILGGQGLVAGPQPVTSNRPSRSPAVGWLSAAARTRAALPG